MNDIAMIGLAVMGRSLALNMADHGYEVAAYNRSYALTQEMMEKYPHEHVHAYQDLKECIHSLMKPRKVMLMVKAGKPVDMVIEQLIPLLEEGDIIIDGGNSFFEDTIRREAYLKEKGLHFFGVGISGGEDGARFGPSIMPGGNQKAYEEIRHILEDICAKAEDGKACCTYIGENGAGHYVKMVHNGIEYADMQLIAEAYLLLKHAGGFDNKEIHQIFEAWNDSELNSFLIQITADIFKEKDDLGSGELLDKIVDSAAQKGTGRWTSIEALKQGVDISMITASCNARIMSNQLKQRQQAHVVYPTQKIAIQHDQSFVDDVKDGLYTAKIIAYAQGFDLLKHASNTYQWNLSFGEIASIFRAGCIIRAQFLNDIMKAYARDIKLSHLMMDEFFSSQIQKHQESLRRITSLAIEKGIAVPAMSNAISYLDMFSSTHLGANLIQAQRDYFGAHTYERIDQVGSFHHAWGHDHE